MFKAMVNTWIACAFIMTILIVASIVLDAFRRAVQTNFDAVAWTVMTIVLVGLAVSIWKVVNAKNNH